MPTAGNKKKAPTPQISSLTSGSYTQLDFLPDKLREKLLPFQKDGIIFALRRDGRCMVADEMGLGKTIQAIAVAYFYKEEWPLLIVVPSSLRYPWTEELEKWIPELEPQEINIIMNKTDIGYFGKRRQWDCRGASNLGELHQLLSDIMIRRLKSEVLSQLPPKVRQRIPFDLPPAAVKELNASFEEWQKLMRAPNSGAVETVMGLITRMFKQTAIAKAGAVKDYIKMLLQNESLKFLVFAHHLTMLQACTEAVIENKARYIRIDGSVPSSERIHLVNQFQKDPDTRVAILSIQAAGQGLTFTAASHVVFAELYWDPGHIKQAEDRAHRIGQCSSMNVHYLIANGTLDSLMWALLNRKAQVTGSTLNGRKEKLQATEEDKEKWGFLQFAEAWTPRDSCEELSKDAVFTHFEKEKQHDIRSFFLPKSTKRPLETSKTFKKTTVAPSPGKVTADDSTEDRNGSEPEAKRLKTLGTKDPSSALEGRPPLQARATAMDVPEVKSPLASPALPEKGWQCGVCTFINDLVLPYCEMCENPRGRAAVLNCMQDDNKNGDDDSQKNTSRNDQASLDCVKECPEPPEPEQLANSKEETWKGERKDRLTSQAGNEQKNNSGTLPVCETFMFCASKNTDRIHLYTQDGKPMNCNFIPLDIKLDLWEDLPAKFQLKQNRSQILRLVREWNSLTAMKQKMIRKSGQLFCSPVLALEEITKQQVKENSAKRYITKEDVATASMNKVKTDGGHIRLITKESRPQDPSIKKLGRACVLFPKPCPADLALEPSPSKGYIQAVDKEGRPLCLRCQHPTCQPEQGSSAWDSRFCSLECQEEFWIRSNNSYLRAQVFAAEHGVCQLCGVNAQELFLRVRDAPKSQRKSLLDAAWTEKLPLEQLNEMLRNPGEGHFWQVDHIKPVYEGGGQCSLDNLQTLCTVCHRERTAQQAKERNQARRRSLAMKHGSDITRFLVKK
ncbi:DNA annealing helicase and endonuclease ZRANB3 isoform X3 [Microtus pennsylvanicus]|uniref:DNA annealing helicase and endonuclease ZRANB3 isoform X3 n=1 Tax=Microtus pennsylvanicus TaxID=10058 RepID=UPI003F6D1CAF